MATEGRPGDAAAPLSLAWRLLSLLAWPLVVAAPLLVWDIAVRLVAAWSPDVVVDGGCSEPLGPCAAPLAEVVTDAGGAGRPLVLMVGASVGLAAVRGAPLRHRWATALVLVAGEVALAALVGLTVIRVGAALR
ncbi:MAG TPA: hypothetical protein VFU19_06735 [Iamia sp.]|nr:hypothetical protein [Iamia sp.]